MANAELPEYPPVMLPMVYQAQSPDDVHLLLRMQDAFNDLDCSVTYEQEVEIKK